MKKLLIAAVSLFAPSLAFAQEQAITDVNTLSQKLIDIGDVVIYIMISLGVIFIIWNIVKYIISGDPEKKKEAGSHVLYSIIGLAVILSIWGIVGIFTGTFRTVNTQAQIPVLSNGPQPFVR